MSAPIPLRRDFGAPQLRGLAKKTKDGPQARRLLALAAKKAAGSKLGNPRDLAGAGAGRQTQTTAADEFVLSRWCARFKTPAQTPWKRSPALSTSAASELRAGHAGMRRRSQTCSRVRKSSPRFLPLDQFYGREICEILVAVSPTADMT